MNFRRDDEDSEPENPSEAEEELGREDESSEDGEAVPSVRSYAALMQSFTADSVPQVKRRKLDLVPGSKAAKFEEDSSEIVVGSSDEADELEEGPETATEGLIEDGDDLEDSSDPFEAHFADPDDNVLSRRLKSLEASKWTTQKSSIPNFGKVLLSVPDSEDSQAVFELKPVSGPADLKLKQKLAVVISKQKVEFDHLERCIAPSIFNYQDILFCERRPTNSESLRRLACLHAVNHIFK